MKNIHHSAFLSIQPHDTRLRDVDEQKEGHTMEIMTFNHSFRRKKIAFENFCYSFIIIIDPFLML